MQLRFKIQSSFLRGRSEMEDFDQKSDCVRKTTNDNDLVVRHTLTQFNTNILILAFRIF